MPAAFVGPPTWFVLIAVGWLLIGVACGWLTAGYANRKGYPFFPVFVACMFVPFPLVLLIVAMSPPRDPTQRW